MRITIVKNDDFKTIGLHVETTNPGQFTPERVFSWGISASGFNFSKTVPGDYYEKEVFALVKAAKELEYAENLMQTVCEVIKKGDIKVKRNKDRSFNIGSQEFYDSIIVAARKKVMLLCEVLEEAITNRYKQK